MEGQPIELQHVGKKAIETLGSKMIQHKILFATDFSEQDQNAFPAACDLALRMQAKLIVLHVQDPRFEALSSSKQKDPDTEFKNFIPETTA